MRKLYFAYGANTNLDGMDRRCPSAELVGRVTLPDYRLVFRGVADIVQDYGKEVVGALWYITRDCERALDGFEGYPHLYTKINVPVVYDDFDDSFEVAMAYVMTAQRHESPPSHSYYQCLYDGYIENGIPLGQLNNAHFTAHQQKQEHGTMYRSKQWGA